MNETAEPIQITRYGRVAIALHWLIGLALLAQIVFSFLLDDPAPVRAAAAEATGAQADGLHGLRLTLTEGKYHQVKRMLAAVGNRVETLQRSRFGELTLPPDLAPGQWRWLPGPQVLYPG